MGQVPLGDRFMSMRVERSVACSSVVTLVSERI